MASDSIDQSGGGTVDVCHTTWHSYDCWGLIWPTHSGELIVWAIVTERRRKIGTAGSAWLVTLKLKSEVAPTCFVAKDIAKMALFSINCAILTVFFLDYVVSQTQYKRLEYKYSFKGPYIVLKDNTVPFWDVGGRKYIDVAVFIIIHSCCICCRRHRQWWSGPSCTITQSSKRYVHCQGKSLVQETINKSIKWYSTVEWFD